jgi:hypothetical protein
MRTRWRRLLDVDDVEHLRGIAELFNLDGAQSIPLRRGLGRGVSLPSGYSPELAFGILARDDELLALGGYLKR